MNTITNPSTTTSTTARAGTLSYLPVAFFGAVMGLTGLAVAWRFSHTLFNTPLWIAHVLGAIALAAFVLLSAGYAIKAATDFAAVRAEFNHPIAGNLFGTPLISLLLLPLLLAELNLTLARVVWVIGAVLMTLFAWFVVMRWMTVQQKTAHATPAWIVPVVGMIDVPLAVPSLGWFDSLHGVMVFATAIGLFFAIPLFTLILSRLMFDEPIPDAMQPSLLIMVAPFSVGFSAYVTTVGQIDVFAQALYMLMLFMLAVLFGRLRKLPSCCPFKVSWWAVSFPLAASANAALHYAAHAQHVATNTIAIALLVVATVVIVILTLLTLIGIGQGKLRALSV
jgi:tellurite resistance protein